MLVMGEDIYVVPGYHSLVKWNPKADKLWTSLEAHLPSHEDSMTQVNAPANHLGTALRNTSDSYT